MKIYYEITEDVKELIGIEDEVFPISLEEIKHAVDKTIEGINNDLNQSKQLEYISQELRFFPNAIEYGLAKHINENELGLKFHQGNRKTGIDIECDSNDLYSVELKTVGTCNKKKSSMPRVTGSSNYASNSNTCKRKDVFYIFVNYEIKENKIERYRAWFGFIKHSDWFAYSTNGAGILKFDNEDLINRIVEI